MAYYYIVRKIRKEESMNEFDVVLSRARMGDKEAIEGIYQMLRPLQKIPDKHPHKQLHLYIKR